MAKAQVEIKKFYFKKPPLLSEAEFISYKQIFLVNPEYDITPKAKSGFIEEFLWETLSLIGLVIGFLLTVYVSEIFAFIAAISIWGTIGVIFGGRWISMLNYQNFLDEKNRYFKNLKRIIIESNNYQIFMEKASMI